MQVPAGTIRSNGQPPTEAWGRQPTSQETPKSYRPGRESRARPRASKRALQALPWAAGQSRVARREQPEAAQVPAGCSADRSGRQHEGLTFAGRFQPPKDRAWTYPVHPPSRRRPFVPRILRRVSALECHRRSYGATQVSHREMALKQALDSRHLASIYSQFCTICRRCSVAGRVRQLTWVRCSDSGGYK